MSGSEPEPSQRTKSSHLLKTRLIGGISLILWGTAIGCLAVQGELAYDRPKAIVFARGVLMIDLTLALLASLVWCFAKYYLAPQIESRAVAEYAYRAGCRDATLRLMQETELHVVRNMPPPDAPLRPEYLAKTNGRQRTGAPT